MKIEQRRDVRSYTTKYIICGVVSFINFVVAALLVLKQGHHHISEILICLLQTWGLFCVLSLVSLVYFFVYDCFIVIINNYSERDCIDYNVGMTEEYLDLSCLTCIVVPALIYMVGGVSWILLLVIIKLCGIN